MIDFPCLCLEQHTIRALALRVLKEILKNQPARFKNYAELTIMKTLEAHKDSHKEVNSCCCSSSCLIILKLPVCGFMTPLLDT